MKKIESSLYIHIPFCKSKCTYCDFFSVPINDCGSGYYIPDSYMKGLLNELAIRVRTFGITQWKTVYIGGGTPSLLTAEQLSMLLKGIKEGVIDGFSNNVEITIEANPADISTSFLNAISEFGINRLSMGVQTYSKEVLKLIGRRGDAEVTDKALKLIKNLWISQTHKFSVDIISGLPNLEDEDFILGLNYVLSYNPDHISLYSLTVEEETPLYSQIQNKKVIYSDEDNERQWLIGRDILIRNGYMQYEVSNFAKNGNESKHNKVYWHLEDYVGVGAGASGTMSLVKNGFIEKNDDVKAIRWSNNCNINEYIQFWSKEQNRENDISYEKENRENDFGNEKENKENDFANEKIPQFVETISKETREFEFLMMGFRLLEGVSSIRYEQIFNEKLAKRIGADTPNGIFSMWEKKGLAKRTVYKTEQKFALTTEGILLLNRFLEEVL